MRLDDAFVEEVRTQASIVAVVQTWVPLKKAGQSYKGLCPFHAEKTPSFNVNEERGFFHCFGCGRGGDVFKFVMEMEKLGFVEAVEKVAALVGLEVPRGRTGPRDDRRQRLYAINERALTVFRETLGSAAGAAARSYLAQRGLTDEVIEQFELGLSPEGWEGLSRRLLAEGCSAQELIAAGLAKERPTGRGIYDRFHERIIFPIRAVGGRLVGFGGRALGNREPKYLNSPETELYHKSEILYGLERAHDAVRRAGFAVLVEGYLDLISLHQRGVPEAVASLGTSVTERHARLIGRYAPRVVLCYDGDRAGRAASRRALGILLPVGLEVVVVRAEPGQDPDDMIRAEGGEAFRQRIERAPGFLSFLLAEAAEQLAGRGDAADRKVQLVNEVLPVLAAVTDPVRRAVLIGELGAAVGIEERVLRDAVNRSARSRPVEVRREEVKAAAPAGRLHEAEGLLILALLSEGGQELSAELDLDDLAGRPSERLVGDLVRVFEGGGVPEPARLVEGLTDGAERSELARLLLRAQVVSLEEGRAAARKLRSERIRRELHEIQRAIHRGGDGRLDELLARKVELSRLRDALENS